MSRRLVLCTDMDRTIIPNGRQPEHLDARRRFHAFCQHPDVTVVYVTGRHRRLVEKAIRSYQLPQPDYVISDVGTKLYKLDPEWQELDSWKNKIAADWQGKTHADLKKLLQPISVLQLQEFSKQNTHKLSFYLPMYQDNTAIISDIQQRLQAENIDASVMWSIDELKNIGLIDVLPRHATKLHAILFLQQELKCADKDLVFAGDSGNDMPVLASAVQSILVNNASNDIKSLAYQLASDQGHENSLYIAQKDGPLGMNGNYSAGVLQGVWHYAPDFRDILETETPL